MSNNGQAIQAFNKKAGRGFTSALAPMALMAAGVSLVGLAILTAVTPAPVGALAKAADILNRIGLDKGPLLLFGVTLGALGLALMRVERAARASSSSQGEMGFGEQIVDDLEGQSAIMASLQGELGAARSEIAELSRQTQETVQTPEDNTASDPMFRLAASLDQLGAQIGKHLDSVARNLDSSIQTVQSSVQDSETRSSELAEQRFAKLEEKNQDRSQDEQVAAELNGMRSQIAGLMDSMDSLVAQVEAIEIPVAAQVEVQLPRELEESAERIGPLPEPVGDLTIEHSPEPSLSSPTSQARGLEGDVQPTSYVGSPMGLNVGPVMGPSSEDQRFAKEDPAPLRIVEASNGPTESVELPSFGPKLTPVMPADSEFPSPPLPLPMPSEGLELIDEMNKDTARITDLTPPLFPELGDGTNG